MMGVYCKSLNCNKVNQMEFDSDVERMHWIPSHYQTHHCSEGILGHEPLQVVALFMQSMLSYLRCKHAIATQDGWHLEIESCNGKNVIYSIAV